MPSLLSTVFRDGRLVFRGFRSFLRDMRAEDRVACSISLFSASSFDAVRSQPVIYLLTLVNNSTEPLDRKLLIEIQPRENFLHPAGHHARFGKAVRLLPGRSIEIPVTYDWAGSASFSLNGIAEPPDEFSQGPVSSPGRYAVHALLLDADGKCEEDLFIVQNLIIP